MIASSLWMVAADGGLLGLSFCACWRIERRQLGPMLADLAEQKLALGADAARGGASAGGPKSPSGVSRR